MRMAWVLSILLLLPGAVSAAGKALPRGLDALGVAIPVNLDMTSADLNKIKGKVSRSGKFVGVETDSGHVASMTWNETGDRVVKISAQLPKNQCSELARKLQDFSEGNQYEKERVDRNVIHTWKDGKTVIRVVSTEDFCRLDLMNFKESED